ncbi:MAG: DUF3786 domain-containing protein [Desulfobacula sp.]|nr:DUF3786 domain-containing protein [Desulfobacula sp.]
MPLSVVDLYAKILPKTNCKECGFLTCIAFAGMVVSEMHPLKNCPHIKLELLEDAQKELDEQYKQGKWLKKDMALEALAYAKKQTASMSLEDVALRIGGELVKIEDIDQIKLPYFNQYILISNDKVIDASGKELSRNEQTFVYIHIAQGGIKKPTGSMKSFKEFPNTVSKVVSMKSYVEEPLKKAFTSNLEKLKFVCEKSGGKDVIDQYESCDLAFYFSIFPKIPVTLLFWDQGGEFDADAKLLFDETIIEHLDIESIIFLSEHLCKTLIS